MKQIYKIIIEKIFDFATENVRIGNLLLNDVFDRTGKRCCNELLELEEMERNK